MTTDDTTLSARQQIDHLKQQIEEATNPEEKRRLQSQLKKLQILHAIGE